MPNRELKKVLSEKGNLHNFTVGMLKHATALFEGTEIEIYPPSERRGASIYLASIMPVLYDPNNDENCELFRRSCYAIMEAIPKEEDDEIKSELLSTLYNSMSAQIFQSETEIYIQVVDFYTQVQDDDKFGMLAQGYALDLLLKMVEGESADTIETTC